MTTEKNQSAIAEVRDQLSLDFADAEFLNVLSQNLGLDRPVFGFSDDDWRAIVKELAIEFKQIATKFDDVFAIILGPRITQVGTLAESVLAGESSCFLNDSSNLPQTGTMIFDEGLSASSTLSVLAPISATTVTLVDSSAFPTVYPYTVTIAPGTSTEQTVTVTDNTANVLTFTEPLTSAQAIGVTVNWGTEETLEYCYIDRRTNEVFFTSDFVYDHLARNFDSEETILGISPDNKIVFAKTNNFPTVSSPVVVNEFPYPAVVGRGTSAEEVVQVFGNDIDSATLTIGSALTNTHRPAEPSDVAEDLAQNYFITSAFVLLDDSTQFPDEGIIRLEPATQIAVTVNTPLTTDRTIQVAASTFDFVNSLVGYELVFTTGALTGLKRRIIENTANVITVDEDFTTPGSAPLAGDDFIIYPIVKYTSNDSDSGTLNLRKPIIESVFSGDILTNSRVQLMREISTVALSPVKVLGTGWDIIQSTPGLVEILIPEDLRDPNDLRSASYLHDDTAGTPSTTVSSAPSIGDVILPVTSAATFPEVGTVDVGVDRLTYSVAVDALADPAAAGAVALVLENSSDFPTTGTAIIDEGTALQETVTITGNNTSTNTLTVAAISNDHKEGVVLRCISELRLQAGVTVAHPPATAVTWYQPLYAATTLPVGDYNQQPDTWPGPYVYEIGEPAATGTVAQTNATGIIAGPSLLAISQVPGRTAIELENALAILASLTPPFNIILGVGSGSREIVSVTDVNVSNRAVTTLAAAVAIGDTSIQVTDLTPEVSGGDGGAFPNTRGYRVIINEDQNGERTTVSTLAAVGSPTVTCVDTSSFPTTYPYSVILDPDTPNEERLSVTNNAANVLTFSTNTAFEHAVGAEVIYERREVLYVNSTASGPDRLILENSAAQAHTIGSTISLVRDVLTVESISKVHDGVQDDDSRSTFLDNHRAYFSAPEAGIPEIVSPRVESITVASSVGLSPDGGRVLLNFGHGQIKGKTTVGGAVAPGATALTVADGSVFPSTFPFIVKVGDGLRYEENLLVTNRVGNVLTFGGGTYGVLFNHAVGEVVTWEPGAPEDIEYDEIDTNDLRFDPEIVLQYTHYPVESVIDSSADSDPRTNGFDFPFRMPVDIEVRLRYLIDLIRAAGIQVELIEQR